MLENAKIAAFVATAGPDAAKDFYGRVLGLRLLCFANFQIHPDRHPGGMRAYLLGNP